MVNYQNGKIYKLVNNVDDKIYVGSTCNLLRVRKGKHKITAKGEPTRHVYAHLNGVGWINVEIILIETCPCDDKDELHKRERYWIDELKPELNREIPGRTSKEWYVDNKVKVQLQCKEYYTENKEHIKQKSKEYYETNKDIVSRKGKEKYQNEKGIILQRVKNHRDNNKAKLSQRQKEKILCGCGTTTVRSNLANHRKTAKHIRLVNELDA